MRKLLLHSTPVPYEELDDTLLGLAAQRGKRRFAVRLSDALDAPSAVGFFRPAVIMPRSLWGELNSADLRQIVLHELAHLDRRDDWTNLLQKLLRALSPLNPALLWAEHHLCRERERACDDAVLETAGDARAYAGCLTKLAESRLVRRAAALAPGLWKRPSELASRIDSILHRRRTLSPALSRGLLAASALAALAGAVQLQRCPGLIAFTASQERVLSAADLAGDLAPAKIVKTKFAANADLPQAAYHDAVFHFPQNAGPAALTKRAPKTTRPRLRPAEYFYTSSVRLVNLSQDPNTGESIFTVVVFTVHTPQAYRASHIALPLAESPTISLPDSWIAFRI